MLGGECSEALFFTAIPDLSPSSGHSQISTSHDGLLIAAETPEEATMRALWLQASRGFCLGRGKLTKSDT